MALDLDVQYIESMATYTISSDSDRDGFCIVVIGDNGARQTLLGFKTKAAAEAWVVEDEQRSNAEVQSNFRMQWRF